MSGFGPAVANVPPVGQVVLPNIATTPTMVAPPIPQQVDLPQSQQTLPTMIAPPAPNCAPPLPAAESIPQAAPMVENPSNGMQNISNDSLPSGQSAVAEYAAIPPPAVVTLSMATAGQVVTVSDSISAAAEKLSEEAEKAKQEELQKKLMEGQEPATIEQQENMQIKGQSARHLVMQKVK